jgi:hypothetical protein
MQTGVSQPYLQRHTLRNGQSCNQTSRRTTGVGTTARRTSLRQQRSCVHKQARQCSWCDANSCEGASPSEGLGVGGQAGGVPACEAHQGRRSAAVNLIPPPMLQRQCIDQPPALQVQQHIQLCVHSNSAQEKQGRQTLRRVRSVRMACVGCGPGRTVVAGVLAVQVAGRVREGAQEAGAVGAIPLDGGLGHLAVALRTRRRGAQARAPAGRGHTCADGLAAQGAV